MAEDCMRERLGLKAQTRIRMRENRSGLPCWTSKVQSPTSNVIGPSTLHFGLWTLDFGLLEIQLQSELKLARIEGSGRAAVVTTVTRSLIESAHVVDERRRCSFVEPIEQIEAFSD